MGLERFWKASDNHPLAKAQLFYFFYDAATKSLPRYLGLYFKHTLLLSPHQVAALLSARYFSLLFGSPVLGSIADKTNRFRNVLIICLLAFLATYILVPLVEPVDGFNCQNHLHNRSLRSHNVSNAVNHHSHHFHVKIHKYNSEIKTDTLGEHYHGNLMYDLFYTWPFETWEYLKTDKITHKVFIALLFITLIGEFFASPGETFVDLYTLQTLGMNRNNFGLQIIPGLIGWSIISITFAVLTNLNVDLKDDFCHVGRTINYSPYLFVIYGMIFVCILAALLFKYTHHARTTEDINKPAFCRCNFFTVLPILAKTPSYSAFAIVVIFCGMGTGIKQLFIYHYITELGGPLTLLPIVTAVHFASNMAALLLSPVLLKKYGNINLIYAGLFTNGVTFIVYSIIEKPYYVFLVEPLDGICSQLTWVAIVTYVGSPPGIGAALQGSVHGLYRGLGVAVGYMAVSVMILRYGYLALFLGLGLIYFVIFGFYMSVVYYFPKTETIAEEYSDYALLFNHDLDADEDEMDMPGVKPVKETGYGQEKMDTSFLE